MAFGIMGRAVLAGAAVVLTACSHVPVASWYQLATLDPLSIDPADLRAGVKYPGVLQPKSDGITLNLKHVAPGETPLEESLALEPAPVDAAALVRDQSEPGYVIGVYRLAPADVDRVRAFQAEVKRRKAAGRDGKGSLSIGAAACRRTADLPDRKLLLSTYLRTARDGGFITLLDRLDMMSLAPRGQIDTALPVCPD